MANTTNEDIRNSWVLIATGASGTIANIGTYDIEVAESNAVPTVNGMNIRPDFASAFSLTAGQSLYARSAQGSKCAITLE